MTHHWIHIHLSVWKRLLKWVLTVKPAAHGWSWPHGDISWGLHWSDDHCVKTAFSCSLSLRFHWANQGSRIFGYPIRWKSVSHHARCMLVPWFPNGQSSWLLAWLRGGSGEAPRQSASGLSGWIHHSCRMFYHCPHKESTENIESGWQWSWKGNHSWSFTRTTRKFAYFRSVDVL